jgi:signal peptidase I
VKKSETAQTDETKKPEARGDGPPERSEGSVESRTGAPAESAKNGKKEKAAKEEVGAKDDPPAEATAEQKEEEKPKEKDREKKDKKSASLRPPSISHPPARRGLKTLYWAVWFVSVPLILACFVIWALTPPSGVDHGGALGWVQSLVREQPVPVAIVCFTLFEMALWAVRHHLPLHRHAHPPLRDDLPQPMKAPFERARLLVEEAASIYEKNEKAIVRELSAKEREALAADLEALEDTMHKKPFDEDAFVEALLKADNEVDAKLGRWRKSEVREYMESIFVAVAVAMALRAFVVEAFKIPSGSMIPTLMVGDHIFVNKFTYGPAIPWTHKRLWNGMPPSRGDVMVFAFPEHPEQDFIKRVIAIPGDKLEAQGGHPIINGWEVPSCRVGPYSYVEGEPPLQTKHEGDLYVEFLEDEAYLTFYDGSSMSYPEHQGPFTVKPGEVWVMGDNRNNSHDSRMWWGGKGGGVPFENIKGRALFVWLSVADSGVDWSRLGAPVMGRPRLPKNMKSLEPAIDKCFATRPPLEKTTPPPPPR